MLLGIVSIVIGVFWFILSLSGNIDGSAVRQTVQYLGFVCGSIFVVGGMIMIKLDNLKNRYNKNIENNKQFNTDEEIREKEEKIKIIIENIGLGIKEEDVKNKILSKSNRINAVYEILKSEGKIKMNEYLKYALNTGSKKHKIFQ